MTELVATTPGLYPLPEWAKDDLSDLKGHQKDDLVDGDEGEAVRSVYDRVRAEYVETQRSAGLDRIVEGQARWDDVLAHPLAVHDAVETRGIVRYYDNNNFYREVAVTGDLEYSGDVPDELASAAGLLDDGDSLQAVLPGPYSLADLATDEQYGDDAAFQAAIGEFLAGEAAAFPETVETLFLLEPSLVANPPGDGADERASEAIDAVARATDADVVVQPYWGALDEKVHAHVLDADIDALGYDLVSAPEASVDLVAEYGTTDDVAIGVVDGQHTVVESAETVRDRVDWFQERVPPTTSFDTIYATTNTESFYLPVGRFEAKLAALGAATERREVTA